MDTKKMIDAAREHGMDLDDSPVAYEFYNPKTGHAIVDYTRHTHVGHLTEADGYIARPLVYASDRPSVATPELTDSRETLRAIADLPSNDPLNIFDAKLLAIGSLAATDRSSHDELSMQRLIWTLTNAAQLLDTIKMEWSATDSWSEHDQSVRGGITECLRELTSDHPSHAVAPEVSSGGNDTSSGGKE